MEKKLKILHIFPEFSRGGAPVNTLRFIKASQDEAEHHGAGKKSDPELFNEYAPYALPHDIDLTRPSASSACKLWKLIRTVKPDIIHCNGKGGSFYAWLLSPLLPGKIKFFLTLRGYHDKFSGLKSRFYRHYEGVVARRCSAVISVSPSERQHYQAQIKVSPQKVKLIANGIGIQKSKLDDNMQKVLDGYAVNIVSLSRMTPQKDLLAMIQAFEKATGDNPDSALHVIGGLTHGERVYEQEVKKVVNASAAKSRIYLWGDVKQAGNLVHHFDLYLSTALFEGLPTAVVEAFLSGVPVVATDCIGNVDLVRNGETGWLAIKGDVPDIARALKEGIQSLHTPGYQKIAYQAREEGLKYSIENQAQRLLALYNESP